MCQTIFLPASVWLCGFYMDEKQDGSTVIIGLNSSKLKIHFTHRLELLISIIPSEKKDLHWSHCKPSWCSHKPHITMCISLSGGGGASLPRGEFAGGDFVRGDFVRGDFVRGDFVKGEPVRGEFTRGRVDWHAFVHSIVCTFCNVELQHDPVLFALIWYVATNGRPSFQSI